MMRKHILDGTLPRLYRRACHVFERTLAPETLSCGDGYNDQSMMEFAGLGVATANAPRDIQEKSDYITCSNEEDGVAHVAEKFILKAT